MADKDTRIRPDSAPVGEEIQGYGAEKERGAVYRDGPSPYN
jgi:hypothetical protein